MTEDMLRSVLDISNAKQDDDGWLRLPEHQLLTLYTAHEGVQLTVGKVEALRVAQGIVRARTTKGDTYFVALQDMFAMSLDGGTQTTPGRKAGFLG
ncbi:hypothetical protein [Polyangium aurulentum]|uniref:hypothetical protein n=1 Tax=Polyangium aurulentum TaxID=2567896 RepID=UPI0010AE7368|nr:hypothetical protein [Polyangium aurulentum]UQA55684.1 hypothetical protein E8A73_030655 [Polyangium aurulentum]